MSDARTVRRNLKRLQVVKTWQLLILLVLMTFITATFLRLNNTGMVTRRNAVYAADKSASQDDLTYRVYDLQRFASAHMNADTGVFYLQETYNRDVKQLVEASSTESTSNQTANDAAEAVCHPQFSSWSPAYVRCFVNELNKHAGPDVLPSVQLPSAALYRYSFVSPVWSSDFAGWSLIITLLLLFAILGRLVSLVILKVLVKRRYREI